MRMVRVLVWILLFFALVRTEFGLALPAAGILIIMYGSRLWSRLGVARLGLSLSADRVRVFPGDAISLTVELRNDKLLPVWVGLDVAASEELHAGPLHGETRLTARERSTRVWQLTALRRGIFSLGPARLSVGDLLGFHVRTKEFRESGEIVVYPRLLELRHLDIPFREYFGIHASRGPVDDPAWYAGTRDYTGNRPAKNIHWKASARLGVMQEKLYEPTSHRKVLFVLDSTGFPEDAPPDDFERMLETAGTLASALMETGGSFGFLTNAGLTGGRNPLLPMGRGPEHLGVLLEMLARAELTAGEDLAVLLREADPDHTGLVYLGAGPTDRIRTLLRATASRRRRRMLFVFARPGDPDASDSALPGEWEGYPACAFREVVDVPET